MSFVPSLLFNNIFDPISRNESEIMDYYKELYSIYEYQSLETRLIFDKKIRKEFAEFVEEKSVNVTIWVTSNMNNMNLSLADPDEKMRKKAVSYMKELIDLSIEANAKFIGFTSGKKVVSSSKIAHQINSFEKSIIELLDYIDQYNQVELMLEPLDTDVDKKGVVGSTRYVVSLFEKLTRMNKVSKFSVCIDTAHIVLNNEDIFQSMEYLSSYSQRIHLANVVLDKSSYLFGDNHLPMGAPGFLTQEVATDILKKTSNLDFQSSKVYVAIEVRGKKGEDLFKLEKETRDFLLLSLPK